MKFLESIGAKFGACQNAYTSVDETVYELTVPSDDPKLLEQAFSVLAQFASAVRCACIWVILSPVFMSSFCINSIIIVNNFRRCSPEDLQVERGPVLEEWRMGKDSVGRAQEAHWELILQGSKVLGNLHIISPCACQCMCHRGPEFSFDPVFCVCVAQYAQRLPIGLKEIIQGAPADVVRSFYERWYRPEHQAVVVTGDFDPEAVVAMLTEKLEGCQSRDPSPAPAIPRSSTFLNTSIHVKRALSDSHDIIALT